MPQVTVLIGGREFDVACQPGEEPFLQTAAGMLDREAQSFVDSSGRLSESKILLMAGLLLADRTVALEEKVKNLESNGVERVEVPVVPQDVTDKLSELAAQAEALAEMVEK